MGGDLPLFAILGLVVLFFVVIFIRAFLFVPKKKSDKDVEKITVNSDKATADLAEMIKCKTISNLDASLDDQTEFDKFEALLLTIWKPATVSAPAKSSTTASIPPSRNTT